MKKMIIILLALTLCSCKAKEPAVPTDNPQPVPIENSPIVIEHIYEPQKDWIVWEIDLQYDNQTYNITPNLQLTLNGTKQDPPYCQNGCLVYDSITLNGKDITLLERQEVKVNEDYGTLNLYNLNDELFLLNFNYAAQINSCAGVVFNAKGEIIKEYENCDLTMNTIYQNQFALSFYDPETNESQVETYEAKDGELLMEIIDF